jgi:replication factor C subunit 2/4
MYTAPFCCPVLPCFHLLNNLCLCLPLCKQVLLRLKQVCALESVSYDDSGLEAIIFTAEGDMRNALNSLQSTVSGFSLVTAENVFKVCDVPHPVKMKAVVSLSRDGRMKEAQDVLMALWGSGYAATDIIQVLFRVRSVYRWGACLSVCLSVCDFIFPLRLTSVCRYNIQVTRTSSDLTEPQKLEFLREIGFSHMKIAEGLNTQLQLMGCVARLCQLNYRNTSSRK